MWCVCGVHVCSVCVCVCVCVCGKKGKNISPINIATNLGWTSCANATPEVLAVDLPVSS